MKRIFTTLIFFIAFGAMTITSCKKEDPDDIIVDNPDEKSILVAPFNAAKDKSTLMVLDEKGELKKSIPMTKAALNFQKWNINGKTRYSYIEFDPTAYNIPNVGYVAGWAVILDENFNEIKRVQLLPNKDRTSDDEMAVDGHEFILLGDNHYVVMAYFEKAVNNIPASLNPVPDCRVVACIVQEIKDNKVIWEWDGTDYPEFYQTSIEKNKYEDSVGVQDYMHMNGISIDPKDNNFIFSLRHMNQVIKVNRTTGDIIWRLGGADSDFPMTADMKFLRQHHATFLDNGNKVMIFDNGEAIERNYTRIVEFELNENAKTITNFSAFNLPDHTFCQFMGSVQKLGDRYFIGGGSNKIIMDVNYKTNEVVLKKELEFNSYRAFKY